MSVKEQLSIIIRLDRGYEIVERFLKFNKVSRDRTALGMGEVVKAALSKFGVSVKSKLIMQTYDGAAVMSGHLSGLQTLIHQDYPFAFFFIVLHIAWTLFCASLLKVLNRLSGFFLKLILFVHFPHLVLIGRHFLLQKVLIFLVQVKLDGILRPEQSLPFLNSMKNYKKPSLKFKITLWISLMRLFLGQPIFSVILSHSFFAFYWIFTTEF